MTLSHPSCIILTWTYIHTYIHGKWINMGINLYKWPRLKYMSCIFNRHYHTKLYLHILFSIRCTPKHIQYHRSHRVIFQHLYGVRASCHMSCTKQSTPRPLRANWCPMLISVASITCHVTSSVPYHLLYLPPSDCKVICVSWWWMICVHCINIHLVLPNLLMIMPCKSTWKLKGPTSPSLAWGLLHKKLG